MIIMIEKISIFYMLYHFQDYPKLSASYYTLLEILTQDHMQFISTLEPNVSGVHLATAEIKQKNTKQFALFL